MQGKDAFIRAYYEFRETLDLNRGGVLPDLDKVVWYMLMGIPPVPADQDPSEEAEFVAIDQRIAILKALFVESNSTQPDDFLDQGLRRYDEAAKMAKLLLQEEFGTSFPGKLT
ncbi:MAG: hypothetical protein JRJ31_17310 [Deltaproteobacteria bacterium]|nr:hypothetical protein [Deltaproteobacteria bacterium]